MGNLLTIITEDEGEVEDEEQKAAIDASIQRISHLPEKIKLKGLKHVELLSTERVDKSEAVGERLKEAQHINRSLSALIDVIYALAQKSTHIPCRNRKLTQVLQDSLGGHAKTLMFVHINPEANAYCETIGTLKSAERVASIELGAAGSNKETGEIKDR